VESDEKGSPAAYRILLRSPADIVVLQEPAWWTRQRVLVLLGCLAGIILVVLLWAVVLGRRVEERTETLRGALESTADGILVVDSEGRVMTRNSNSSTCGASPTRCGPPFRTTICCTSRPGN